MGVKKNCGLAIADCGLDKVRERPILFSGEMVRAILEGRKTQTRRVGKIQNTQYTELGVEYGVHATKGMEAVATYRAYPGRGTARWGICASPFGVPGDRLWVREKWAKHTEIEACTCYAADRGHEHDGLHWKPSIHMPRPRSRLTLELVQTRVERVQDISEADAKAEGVFFFDTARVTEKGECFGSYRKSFAVLWNSINAQRKFGWSVNPWVWVLEFKVLEFKRAEP